MMKRIEAFMKMSKKILNNFSKEITLYTLLGIVVSLLGAINIFYFQKLLDSYINGFQISVIIVYSVTIILIPILSYLEQGPKKNLSNGIYYFLKKEALKKVSVISYAAYLKLGSGALLQKIETGSNAGRNIYLNFYCRVFRELLPEAVFNLFFIALIDRKLILPILAGYVIVFVITKYLLKVLQQMKSQTLISEEKLNGTLIRGITEMVTFRINKRYKKEVDEYHKMSANITSDLTKMTLIHEFFFASFALLVAAIKVLIVVLFFQGHISITIGGLVALIAYVDKIYSPVAIFNVIFIQYHLDSVSYQRLNEFYNLPNDENLFISSEPLGKVDSINIKDVSMSFDHKQVLGNINFVFDKKKYGLIGESGSGKSTLIKLILGLIKPTTGGVLIDDRNLMDTNLQDYYDHVFYLSQEVAIFQGSLRENIVFDKPITDQTIKEVLMKCQLSEFLSSLPNGLDTQIGEKGANISGGEKQRIAFARLFFSDAEIVIFDEATSALDEETEERILKEINPSLIDKIVIMITHRPKNLTFVDEIIDLNSLQEKKREMVYRYS